MSDSENRFPAIERLKEEDIEDLESEKRAELFRGVADEISELSEELEEKIAKAREVQEQITESTDFDDGDTSELFKETEQKLEAMQTIKISFDELEERVAKRAVMAEKFPESEKFREHLEVLTEQLQSASVDPEEIGPSDVYEE